MTSNRRRDSIDWLTRDVSHRDANLSSLDEITDFGSNPGCLRMFLRIPTRLSARPAVVVALHGCKAWSDRSGRELIESHRIEGMGQGVPLASNGEHGCGTAGPFHIDLGISSSERILEFFGLSDAREQGKKRAPSKTAKRHHSHTQGAPSKSAC